MAGVDEARTMPGRMTEFMQRGAVPIDRLEIGLWRRDLHIIFRRRIEGAIAADTKRDAGRLDQGFDPRLDQAWWRWRRGGGDLSGSLALIGVEHGKALEEWNRLCFFASLGGASLLVARHKAVGVDNRCAAFALADMAAKRERLAKGKPALSGKTVLDRAPPEQENVDATVGTVGRSIFRQGQRRFCRGRTPGLDPGHAAGLELGDDLVGDFVIEGRPVLTGARASSMV